MKRSLTAKKTVALLHDPVIKALLMAGAKINGVEGDGEDEHLRAVAKYTMGRFIGKLNEGKKRLADAVEEEVERWWSHKGEVKEADRLSAGSERAFAEAVFAKPVDKVLFMNVFDGHTVNLKEELMEKADKKSLDEFAEELADVYSAAEDGFEFHALWRALLPVSAKRFTPKASLLPADTRTPFLTIYDHLYATSALTTCLAEGGDPAVMVFEVKRIQEFISSSRALRDLWASSYLMSLMTLYVIGRLSEELGPDVFIKPCLLGMPLYDLWLQCRGALQGLKGLPLHKMIAPVIPAQVVMLAPVARSEEIAGKVLEYYREAWSKVLETVKSFVDEVLDEESFVKHSEKSLYGLGLEELWKQAMEPPFEVQVSWVEVPIDKNKRSDVLKKLADDGLIARESIEELNRLAEKVESKDAIPFELPLFERAVVRKATLAGQALRISGVPLLKNPLQVSDRDGTCTLCWHQPAALIRPRSQQSIATIRPERSGFLKEGERLCLSCAVKRLLGTEEVLTDVMEKLIGDGAGKVFKGSLERYRPPAFFRILPVASTDTVSALTFKLTALKLAVKNEQVLDAIEQFMGKVDELIKDVNLRDVLFRDPFYPCRAVESVISDVSQRRDVLLKFVYINGTFLHESGLRAFEEHSGVDRKKISEAVKALKKLQKKCRNFIKTVSSEPYFASAESNLYIAIIRADGDDMGQMISLTGNFKKKIENLVPEELKPFQSDEEELRETLALAYAAGPSHLMATSRALSSLAMEVYEECYLRGAIPVYCGGDDLLIIAPPEVALALSVSLREKFSTTTRTVSDDPFGLKVATPGLGRGATQSYAIRFIHHLAPLTLELDSSVEQLENKAKVRDKDERKDGLVITYKPRGSSGSTAWLKWTAGSTSPSKLASFILTCASLTAEVPKIFDFSVREKDDGERAFTVEKSDLRLSKQAFRDVWTKFSDITSTPLSTIASYQFRRHSTGEDERVSVKLEDDIKSLAVPLELKDMEPFNVVVEALKSASMLAEASKVSLWGESL